MTKNNKVLTGKETLQGLRAGANTIVLNFFLLTLQHTIKILALLCQTPNCSISWWSIFVDFFQAFLTCYIMSL